MSDNILKEAIARFPKYFGLRGWPDRVFRIGVRESFIDDSGNPKLYTRILMPENLSDLSEGYRWVDFAKGTEAELAYELAPVPERWLNVVSSLPSTE